jgi:DNA-binding protein H-NS
MDASRVSLQQFVVIRTLIDHSPPEKTMSTPDISNLSLPELNDLKNAVAALIKTRDAEVINDARNQIAAIAKNIGVPLKDLIGSIKPKSEGNKVPVKYRDPADSNNQWTGRGRMPRWAVAMNEAGKLESARV